MRSGIAVEPPKRTKIITPEEAARLIFDGDTLAVGGFVGIAVPEALLIALAERFDQTGGPRDLTRVFAAGQGDGGARGLNRLAREGLIRRAIGSNWGSYPRSARWLWGAHRGRCRRRSGGCGRVHAARVGRRDVPAWG